MREEAFERRALLGIIYLLALPQLLQPQTLSIVEPEVWRGELKYWDLRTAGKIDEYMALWHDDFVGWPGGESQPGGKVEIRRRVESDLGSTRVGSYTVKLHPLSVRIYGEVAAVFYRTHTVPVDTAGARVEATFRITHTRRRTAGGWKIIAGMSADEPRK